MKLPTPTQRKAMIAKAIKIAGTQEKLSEAAEISQQTISRLLNDSDYGVSPVVAFKIDKATGGKVSKEALRPDLFVAA